MIPTDPKELLMLVRDIAVDYDGYETIESLTDLINELVGYMRTVDHNVKFSNETLEVKFSNLMVMVSLYISNIDITHIQDFKLTIDRIYWTAGEMLKLIIEEEANEQA